MAKTHRSPRLALNHMVAARHDLPAFFDLCVRTGVTAVEIRNDLAAGLDAMPAADVRAASRDRGLRILSINALQRFNDWTPARQREARTLIDYTRTAGAEAIVLVPVNDRTFAPPAPQRLQGLRDSLAGLRPLLDDAGIIGLIEPLGFAECSLRLKADAVAAIDDVAAAATFRLVHDTFHHVVAGDPDMFPSRTGLIHASGVDVDLPVTSLRDPHRVLVTPADRIDNRGQIARLIAGGCSAPVSLEPFADSVANSTTLAADIMHALDYIAAAMPA